MPSGDIRNDDQRTGASASSHRRFVERLLIVVLFVIVLTALWALRTLLMLVIGAVGVARAGQ